MCVCNLQAHQSNRVCNALALLQCVASHPETRSAFLQGNCRLHHTVSSDCVIFYCVAMEKKIKGELTPGQIILICTNNAPQMKRFFIHHRRINYYYSTNYTIS